MSKVYKSIDELTANAQLACRTFLAECEKCGLKVRITETYRSQKRQNELYAQGRTTPGKKVTWTLNSRHTGRRAWDICQTIKGREYDNSNGFFDKCGAVAKKLGIIWGGTWKTPDRPHFEVSKSWTLPNGYKGEEHDMEEMKKLQEKVAILEKRVTELEEETAVYNYIDENMPGWMKEITVWARDNGVITGTGNGWGMTKTKAETLVMIKNAHKKLN